MYRRLWHNNCIKIPSKNVRNPNTIKISQKEILCYGCSFLTVSPLSAGVSIPLVRVLGQLIFLFSVCFLNSGLFKCSSSEGETAFGLEIDNYSKPLG